MHLSPPERGRPAAARYLASSYFFVQKRPRAHKVTPVRFFGGGYPGSLYSAVRSPRRARIAANRQSLLSAESLPGGGPCPARAFFCGCNNSSQYEDRFGGRLAVPKPCPTLPRARAFFLVGAITPPGRADFNFRFLQPTRCERSHLHQRSGSFRRQNVLSGDLYLPSKLGRSCGSLL